MWTSNLTGHPVYYLPNLNIIISHGGESCLPAPGSTKAVSTPWPLVMQRWRGLLGAVPWLQVSLSGLWACPILPGRANGWGRLRAPFGSHNPPRSLRSSTLAYPGVCACWSPLPAKFLPNVVREFLSSFRSVWPSPILDTSSYWPFKTSLNICILIPAPCSAFFLAHNATVTRHSYLCIRFWLNLNGSPLREGNSHVSIRFSTSESSLKLSTRMGQVLWAVLGKGRGFCGKGGARGFWKGTDAEVRVLQLRRWALALPALGVMQSP